MNLRKFTDPDPPYYPSRYLRRLVVAHMAHHRHRIMKHKGHSLKAKYGVQDNDYSAEPLSYRQYLKLMMKRSTWGEDVVIYAISTLFKLKITTITCSGKRLDEYRCCHDLPVAAADVILIHNGLNHYSFAGKWTLVYFWTLVPDVRKELGVCGNFNSFEQVKWTLVNLLGITTRR